MIDHKRQRKRLSNEGHGFRSPGLSLFARALSKAINKSHRQKTSRSANLENPNLNSTPIKSLSPESFHRIYRRGTASRQVTGECRGSR
jgi:hypothetical protein